MTMFHTLYTNYDRTPSPQSHIPQINRTRVLFRNLVKLKDKSGVDKIIVKKQPYQLLNTSRQFFPCFHALNFHKLKINFRKLGQISSPFCILYECANA